MTLDYTTDARIDPTADLHTATGLPLWYLEPHRTPVRPEDLRIHCTNARRYAGAIDVSLSLHLAICITIAEHLSYPADLVRAVAAHDLHEAYVGDIPTRLKPHLKGWREIEDAWECHVHAAVGIEVPTGADRAAVKRVDLLALELEMTVLGHPAAPLVSVNHPHNVDLAPLKRRFRFLLLCAPPMWWAAVSKRLNFWSTP